MQDGQVHGVDQAGQGERGQPDPLSPSGPGCGNCLHQGPSAAVAQDRRRSRPAGRSDDTTSTMVEVKLHPGGGIEHPPLQDGPIDKTRQVAERLIHTYTATPGHDPTGRATVRRQTSTKVELK